MFVNASNMNGSLDLEEWGNVTSEPWSEWRGEAMLSRDPLYIVVPMTCVYAIILVSGVLGNVSTCVVIAHNKHMHTATNYFLFSLAVSDLLLLVAGLPIEMYHLWSRFPYIFGELVCRVTSFAAETSANATVLTITAFTVERYVAICHPFLSYTVSKLSRAVKYIVAIWLLALCLAVPQAIQFGIVMGRTENGTEVPETAQCTLKWQFLQHAFHISTLVFFVAPMTLITVLYVMIALRLRQSRLIKRPSGGSSDRNQAHVVRMLVAVVVAFFICWAPFHCQRLLAVYAGSRDRNSKAIVFIYNALTYISGILYFVSTTINPLLYHTMSKKFRLAFKTTMEQMCCSPSRTVNHQTRVYSMLSQRGHTNHLHIPRSSTSSFKEAPLTLHHVGRQRPSDTRSTFVHPTDVSPIHGISKTFKLLPRRNGVTISNSSLQDVDATELSGQELARYMGELNRR